MATNEPVFTAQLTGGAVTGVGFYALQEPLTNICLELGWSDRLSRAVVGIIMFLWPLGVAWVTAHWTRKRTIPVEKANEKIVEAFGTSATHTDIEDLLIPTVSDKKGG